jgi:hypothetical protein
MKKIILSVLVMVLFIGIARAALTSDQVQAVIADIQSHYQSVSTDDVQLQSFQDQAANYNSLLQGVDDRIANVQNDKNNHLNIIYVGEQNLNADGTNGAGCAMMNDACSQGSDCCSTSCNNGSCL